jgi:hypothetical protein
MTPLSGPLEAELAGIRKDPSEAVGSGEKAYIPYEPIGSDGLQRDRDPAVTDRLLAEVLAPSDRTYRLAVLHVLGKRSDPKVDPALITALDDAALRAMAAYLLGRPGFKGYPARPRDLAVVRAALRKYLDDTTTFDDPFNRKKTFRTQDFVIGAYVRLTGVEKFTIPDREVYDLIGQGLPNFGADLRASLLARCKELP